MKGKKIFYIVLLIIMIAVIGIFISNLNTKPIENQNTNTMANIQKNESVMNNTNIETNNNSNTTIKKREMQKVTADMNNIFDIKEKMFIQQTSDVYLNLKQYEGKTVRLQGFIYNYIDTEWKNQEYHYVMRTTPGCCGNDGSAGFEIVWDKEYPKDNEWVEAIGVIKSVDEGDYMGTIPVLYLTSLEVKQERGADFVTQ